MLALGGTSAYGIVLFYYFVDRSAVHVLVYVCLPLLMVGTIWLGAHPAAAATPCRAAFLAGTLAFALAVTALLVAVAWSSIGPGFERSALAHAPPGGRGLRDALDRLWDFPPVSPARRPGSGCSLAICPASGAACARSPNMITEVLMRSGRSNRLPLADPIEDGFALEAAPARPAAGGGAARGGRPAAARRRRAARPGRRPGGPGQRAARAARSGRAHRSARALRAARDRQPLPPAARGAQRRLRRG